MQVVVILWMWANTIGIDARLAGRYTSIVSSASTASVVRTLITARSSVLQSIDLLLQAVNIDVLGLCLHVGAFNHFLEDLDLSVLVLDLCLHVLQCCLGQLPEFDLSLQQLLSVLICQGRLPPDLPLKILDLCVFVSSLLLQLVKSLVLLLKMDGLLFDEHLEIALVVQDLLEVLFDTGYKKLILMETLLHVLVFLLQRSDTLLDLAQLIVCLSQQVLQLQVLVVCLALKRLKLL